MICRDVMRISSQPNVIRSQPIPCYIIGRIISRLISIRSRHVPNRSRSMGRVLTQTANSTVGSNLGQLRLRFGKDYNQGGANSFKEVIASFILGV